MFLAASALLLLVAGVVVMTTMSDTSAGPPNSDRFDSFLNSKGFAVGVFIFVLLVFYLVNVLIMDLVAGLLMHNPPPLGKVCWAAALCLGLQLLTAVLLEFVIPIPKSVYVSVRLTVSTVQPILLPPLCVALVVRPGWWRALVIGLAPLGVILLLEGGIFLVLWMSGAL
jgi:hypothetical protein